MFPLTAPAIIDLNSLEHERKKYIPPWYKPNILVIKRLNAIPCLAATIAGQLRSTHVTRYTWIKE